MRHAAQQRKGGRHGPSSSTQHTPGELRIAHQYVKRACPGFDGVAVITFKEETLRFG